MVHCEKFASSLRPVKYGWQLRDEWKGSPVSIEKLIIIILFDYSYVVVGFSNV